MVLQNIHKESAIIGQSIHKYLPQFGEYFKHFPLTNKMSHCQQVRPFLGMGGHFLRYLVALSSMSQRVYHQFPLPCPSQMDLAPLLVLSADDHKRGGYL